ncbi:MAG: Ada metal-binding domain-containing protein [Methanotrichaceae archaeon]
MQKDWKIIISILILASIGLVVGDQISHSVDLNSVVPSFQINHSSANASTTTPSTLDTEKVFVGSIKSNKYHYPSCSAAKKIKPENEIWFSSSADARAHGYVPCKICNPP